MGAPLAVTEYRLAHWKELRRRRLRTYVVNTLGACLVALVLSSTWWLR